MPAKTRRAQILGLITWLAAAFAAGGVGAIASIDAAAFYAQLVRPPWSPPAAVFGPVWSTLYALMGIAAWLVWRSAADSRRALMLFCVQLAANALWSWLFFAWHLGAIAFAEVVVLLALIVATTVAFRRVSRWSAALMLPYLAWVAFAAALTWSIWRANPVLLQ